jgi:hypothetical protein
MPLVAGLYTKIQKGGHRPAAKAGKMLTAWLRLLPPVPLRRI